MDFSLLDFQCPHSPAQNRNRQNVKTHFIVARLENKTNYEPHDFLAHKHQYELKFYVEKIEKANNDEGDVDEFARNRRNIILLGDEDECNEDEIVEGIE